MIMMRVENKHKIAYVTSTVINESNSICVFLIHTRTNARNSLVKWPQPTFSHYSNMKGTLQHYKLCNFAIPLKTVILHKYVKTKEYCVW